MSNPRSLRAQLSDEPVVVKSAHDFLDQPRDAKTIAFLDGKTLVSLDQFANAIAQADKTPSPAWRKLVGAVSIGQVVAVCNDELGTALDWLPTRPWLSHVISNSLLDSSAAKEHLARVFELTAAREPNLLDWLNEGAGRRVRLTHASRRVDRLERIGQWFATQDVEGPQIIELRNVVEELLLNAFYEAPVAAGASLPIPRTRDVALPESYAVDIAYGCMGNLAVVYVRDPFGALSRERLVESLTRRDTESGLRRVFSTSTVVAISVMKNRHTELLVGIPKRGDVPKSFAFHFFFKEAARLHVWKLLDEETGKASDNTKSVTLVVE